MELAKGINLHVDKISKLKTTTINIYVLEELGDNASKFALIPSVLKHGCNGYPTYADIVRFLENLYGAGFRVGVGKKGEMQYAKFNIEVIDDKYAGEDTLTEAVKFIYQLLTQPVLEDGHFKKEYVDIEKRNLINQIKSRINDKSSYAVDRCFEEMCKGEKFAIDRLGSEQMAQSIDEVNLYNYYKDVLEHNPMYIFVTGDVDENKVKKIFTDIFKINRGEVKEIPESLIKYDVRDVKSVTDKLDVLQGKLSMGFRIGIKPKSDDFFKLMVYNGILGGGPHSKLFMNVREKASLAYYAFSRIERFKCVMVISSGIEIKNYQKVVDIIKQQLEDIKEGKITDYEYDSTIKAISTAIKSITDSASQRADFYLNQYLIRLKYDFDEYIEKIKSVTIDDVKDVANKVKLDTIYFMTNKEGA